MGEISAIGSAWEGDIPVGLGCASLANLCHAIDDGEARLPVGPLASAPAEPLAA